MSTRCGDDAYDDSAEHNNAQRLMVNALATRVAKFLPVTDHSAALAAKQYLKATATAGEVLAARVNLGKGIQGRDQSDESNVLRIRTTICALNCMDIEAPCDRSGYFLMSWERRGLGMVELAGAILAVVDQDCPYLARFALRSGRINRGKAGVTPESGLERISSYARRIDFLSG